MSTDEFFFEYSYAEKTNLLPIVYGVSSGMVPTSLIYLAFLLCTQFKTTSFSDTEGFYSPVHFLEENFTGSLYKHLEGSFSSCLWSKAMSPLSWHRMYPSD